MPYKLMTAILCAAGSVLIFALVTDAPGTANYTRNEMTTELALGLTASIVLIVIAMVCVASMGADSDENS